MIEVGPLIATDRPRWTELWRQYLDFYETTMPDAIYEHTWQRLLAGHELNALAARDGGQIVGIVHFLFHPSAWTLTPVCYLQDLFTASGHRGRGTARALITAVAEHSRAAGSTRLYWLTQSDNDVARALYDKVARHTGFIRYEYPMTA